MSEPNARSELQEKILEIQEKRIEEVISSAEKAVSNVHAIWVKVIPILIAFVSLVSLVFVFYGIKNINDLRDEAKKVAQFEVSRILKEKQKLTVDVDNLAKDLEEAREKLDLSNSAINAIKIQSESAEMLRNDVQGLYASLSKNEVDRSVKFKNLKNIIVVGKKGEVDPNVLFNSATQASRLDFTLEALKLLSLAVTFDPKPIYILKKARLENVFGYKYNFTNGELKRSSDPASSIRSQAWETVKQTIKNNPVEDPHLTYSELWNIAERSNHAGYQQDAIDLILELEIKHGEKIPSYAFVILAQLYARQSYANWEENTWLSINKTISKYSKESPMSAWYENTRRELCEKLAVLLDAEERINLTFEKRGLTACSTFSSSEDESKRLLELLKMLSREGKQEL